MRYQTSWIDGRPVHAHNDWLQLLIEYGRIGLVLGAICFVVHLAAGWRNALRLARESLGTGWLPQGMGLGLLSGSLAAVVAQSVHSFFDYRMHLPPVVFLVAMSAGWLASVRRESDEHYFSPSPWWMRVLSIMPIVPGIVLVWWVAQMWPAEKQALRLQNAILTENFSAMRDLLSEAPKIASDNPRYLALAAEAAWIESTRVPRLVDRIKWRNRCLEYWQRSLSIDPWNAEGLRGLGYVRAIRGDLPQSLPSFLRAIALDPNSAAGYESLANCFILRQRYEEAARLLRLSRTLPNASVPPEKIAEIESYLRNSGP